MPILQYGVRSLWQHPACPLKAARRSLSNSASLHSAPVMNTLIIAPQWIGDAVMTEPLMRMLAQQDQHLTVAAVPWVVPIYKAMPAVAQILEMPFKHGGLQWSERRALAQKIKTGLAPTISGQLNKRYDRAYVLPNSLKSAILPWLSGIPERLGYLGEVRYGFLTHRLPNPPKKSRGSMVAHYLELANLGLTNMTDAQGANREIAQGVNKAVPCLILPTSMQGASMPNDLLASSAYKYTVIAPGAEYGSAKRWPSAHFAALISRLEQPVILLGSQKDAALCEEICRLSGKSDARNLAGKTTLEEALFLIAHAKSMISNDSGLMHVAAALGLPQVAIFGSSSPHHTPPLNEKAKVLWLKDTQGLACAPCYKRECPLQGEAQLRCLKDITPDAVSDALMAV